ncbi:MAG TPA: hypothetical protein VM008_19220 [Phycisphaerae bacterium]|nr:hypothetical protein [Phycisphaerae bacterium]
MPFVWMSGGSIARIEQFVQAAGVNEGVSLQDTFEKIPFLRVGGIRTDLPFGMINLAGDRIPSSWTTTMIYPVQDPTLALEECRSHGGLSLPGAPDLIKFSSGLMVRGTGTYIAMRKGVPGALQNLSDAPFGHAYEKDSGLLAMVDTDFASARSIAPKAYGQFFETMSMGALSKLNGNAAHDAGVHLGEEYVVGFLKSLDHAHLSASATATGLRVLGTMDPVGISGKRSFRRAHFPQGVFAEIDFAYPDNASAQWLSAFYDQVPEEIWSMGTARTLQGPADAKRGFVQLCQVVAGPDGQSLGVMKRNGHTILCMVNQYAEEVHPLNKLSAAVARMNAAGDEQGVGAMIKTQTYKTTDGRDVTRFVLPMKKAEPLNLDAIEDGKTLFVTLSTLPDHDVEGLSLGGEKETFSALCSGSVDVGAAMAADDESDPDSASSVPWAGAMDAARHAMLKLVKGEKISWSVQTAEGHRLAFGIEVPMAVIRAGYQSRQPATVANGKTPGRSTVKPVRTGIVQFDQ